MKITDLPDEVCLACGKPLSEDASSTRKYCSEKCKRWYYGTYETAARRRSKRGRTCAQCKRPISLDRSALAIYCCEDCRRTAVLHRQLAPGRPCARCGSPVPVERRYAVTCSGACRHAMVAAQRPPRYSDRPTIRCAWCGASFLQKRDSYACCSRSCAARLRMSRLKSCGSTRVPVDGAAASSLATGS